MPTTGASGIGSNHDSGRQHHQLDLPAAPAHLCKPVVLRHTDLAHSIWISHHPGNKLSVIMLEMKKCTALISFNHKSARCCLLEVGFESMELFVAIVPTKLYLMLKSTILKLSKLIQDTFWALCT